MVLTYLHQLDPEDLQLNHGRNHLLLGLSKWLVTASASAVQGLNECNHPIPYETPETLEMEIYRNGNNMVFLNNYGNV